MNYNFFGKNIEISIKNVEKGISKTKNRIGRFKYRVFFILFSYIIMAILLVYKKNPNEYRLNSIATEDVIAFKDFEYRTDLLDDNLKKKIVNSTTPVYDVIEGVVETQKKRFTQFFQDLSYVNLKDENKIREFIINNKLENVDVDDIVKIGINNDFKYFSNLTDVLKSIYSNGIYNKNDFNKILSKKQIVLSDYEKKILLNFVKPNLNLNKEKTEEKIKNNINALKTVIVKVQKGDIIVKEGEKITKDIHTKLVELGIAHNYTRTFRNVINMIVLFVICFIFVVFSKIYFYSAIVSKGFYPTLILFVIINLLNVLTIKEPIFRYLIPFAILSIISNMFTKNKVFAFTISSISNILVCNDLEWFIIMEVITLIAINTNDDLTNRIDLVKNGFKIGAYQAFLSILYSGIYFTDFTTLVFTVAFSLISGFLTGMICLGIIPYFENTFKILTDIKLLELGDYSFPLLKRMLIEAPGTFYHSIMVGALAEQAAVAIGANPILARVGAYYRDVGKLKRPIYFVENQGGLENLHNKLKPSLSALLLTSHARDGYILAKQYGLPEEIMNIIIEHHGTTMVQYFYYKAVEIGENINETDFRYSGPKPSTKESAIVMLADTVEAAIRASTDKSKEEIENTIRYLIKYKIDDNQLNECDIKLADIEKIVQAFLQVLKAAYHERIQYPKIKQGD